MEIFLQLIKLLVFDAIVVALALGALIPLSKSKPATFAVMKRNFVGYFSNPTGYVFICVFVFLCSVAAFWSQEFFARNLATLDQLNFYFPVIMLVFVPAITMSIWSQERSDGTDELLLTIPATDPDIVLGKYLAAAAIFSVSLLFSQFTNFMVLDSLALSDIDVGLFIATYTGYWLVGLAMLSLGMAASFLTSNLTVSFVLGALFNAPLVCLSLADRLVAVRGTAQDLSWWSYTARFAGFGRGVISLSSALFFLLVMLFGVYLSIILIGRRHWLGGRDGQSMLGHYLIRAVALVLVVFGVSKFVSRYDLVRFDATRGKVSSLAKDSKKLINNLDSERPVRIEAFISKSVPEAYVKTKVDLVNMLRAFAASGGNKLDVRIYENLDPSSDEAQRADEQYGITGTRIRNISRGQIREEDIYMGAAFTCGLDRVVVPFFDRGIPVEYELIRSIATVTKAKRKRLGVVRTDAQLFGGFDMRTGPRPKAMIIQELEKQYEVEEVDLSTSVKEGQYDALMVVQPSSLPQPQLDNLIGAIRDGQPTAIFEDPMPIAMNNVPGTSEPRRPQGGGGMGGMGGMFGGGRPAEPKGNYLALWDLLGIKMVGVPGFADQFDSEVVWQVFNPYQHKVRSQQITPEWVFITPDAPGSKFDAFNLDEPITSGLRQVLLLFPGGIKQIGARDLKYTALMMTGDETGTIGPSALRGSQMDQQNLKFLRQYTGKRYTTAMRIRGQLMDDLGMSDVGSPLLAFASAAAQEIYTVDESITADEAGSEDATDEDAVEEDAVEEDADEEDADEEDADEDARNREIHVVFVSDIDMLHSDFLAIRAQPDEIVNWQFDNVTFILNVIDSLTGDESLVEIRKRKTRHSTLKMVEKATEEARQKVTNQREDFDDKFEEARQEAEERFKKAEEKLQQDVDDMQQRARQGEPVSQSELMAAVQRLAVEQSNVQRKIQVETEALRRERDKAVEKIENELDAQINRVQTQYKLYAGFLPIIPPLVVGGVVWLLRRSREREGITAERRR